MIIQRLDLLASNIDNRFDRLRRDFLEGFEERLKKIDNQLYNLKK